MEHSHLPTEAYTLESAGVDWLTATCYRSSGRTSFQDLGRDLIARQASYGNEVRPFKAGGYHGQQSAGVAYGTRFDTWILKLSSDVARENWRDVKALATNITRADLQLTIRLKQANINYFAAQRERALKSKRGRGRRANVTLISSSLDGDSLYLGKRTSALYARVYDKGKEQRSDHAGILIRQEVEAKAEAVDPLLKQIESASSVEAECARIVSLYMGRFEIQTIASEGDFVWGARGASTPVDAGLGWLKRGCAPTVQRLSNCGRLSEVLEALGIADRVSINADTEKH